MCGGVLGGTVKASSDCSLCPKPFACVLDFQDNQKEENLDFKINLSEEVWKG